VTFAAVNQSEENALVEVDVLPLAAAMAAHEGLQGLQLAYIPLSVAQLTAFVDAAVQRETKALSFFHCSLDPEHLPQLTRLLASSYLRIDFYSVNEPLFIGDGVPTFCAALRASNLHTLVHSGVRLFACLPDGLAVLDALTGHRSIEELRLLRCTSPSPAAQTAVGEALGRLVAAESVLTSLDLECCRLGDAGVGPLFAALAHNTMLQKLELAENAISRECARDVVLPTVRANTSLRKLEFAQPDIPELVEAEQLVRQRQ